jgi:hypothetical protein
MKAMCIKKDEKEKYKIVIKNGEYIEHKNKIVKSKSIIIYS